jgi:LL-diaminopimelate aminotransferase
VSVRESERLRKLPIYVFAELDRLKSEHKARGVDVIDLGMGNPDLPVPEVAVEAMRRALYDPQVHRYPVFQGIPAFREAVAAWCLRRYGLSIDPGTEVIPLLGSKEGLAHLAMALLGRGDVALVPQPAYPAHLRGPLLADATPFAIPQRPGAELFGAGTDLLPDLDAIPRGILKKARMLTLSYPTNPTAFTAPLALFEKALAFARRHRLVLVHDFAYSEVYFENHQPPSLLSIPGAKEQAVEFHSFSKTFSMAGWRLGFAIGNPAILKTLMKFKTNCDYGVFQATQEAGAAALGLGDDYLQGMRATYQRRRDLFVEGLRRLGLRLSKPTATMYLWVQAPPGMTGVKFASTLLDRAGVVVAPGSAFGSGGEKSVRVALVDGEDRLREALGRMENSGIAFTR